MRAEIVLTVLVLVLAATILGVLVQQERRHNRAAIRALSCRFERTDIGPTTPDDWSPSRLSAHVTNNGPTLVRRVVVQVEAAAADGRVGSFGALSIDRLEAGATATATSDEGRTPVVGGSARATLRYSIAATDIERRRWIRDWSDEIKRDFP
jgi:hypothetical protein